LNSFEDVATDPPPVTGPRMKLLRRLVPALAIPAMLLAGRAFVIEPAGFRTRDEVVVVPGWPGSCDGLRIGVLADLHVGSPYKGLNHLERIVARVNAVRPDLVLLPGDFVIQGVLGGTFVPPEDAAEVLSELDAPAGVFAVLGNHDWWLDHERVARAFIDHGIGVLEDASTSIRTGETLGSRRPSTLHSKGLTQSTPARRMSGILRLATVSP
jgi:predicted MPP superfamily phosphohydrolase